jgi:hypothetical protein
MYRSSDYASLLRPPPATAHYNVVYVSLEETTLSIGNVLRAAQAQYGSAIVAADVFPTSKKVALAFAETTEAIKAAGTGLTVGDSTLELTFYAKRRYRPCKLTISNTNCNRPATTVQAIVEALSEYGQVIDVTPRFWRDTCFHNGAWHVTVMPRTAAPPPELIVILGEEAYVDIPRVRRVCRYCKSVAHTNMSCRAGQLARRQEEAKRAVYDYSPDMSDIEGDAAPYSPGHPTTAENDVAPIEKPLPATSLGTPAATAAPLTASVLALHTISTTATPTTTSFAASTPATELAPGDSVSNLGTTTSVPQPSGTTTTLAPEVTQPDIAERRPLASQTEPHRSTSATSMEMDDVSQVSVAATVIATPPPPSTSRI